VIIPAASIDSMVNSPSSAARATAAMDFIGWTAIGMSKRMPVAMLEIPDRTKVFRNESPYLRESSSVEQQALGQQGERGARGRGQNERGRERQRARVPTTHWMLRATTIGI
jgi:hypothetical protein